MLAVGLAGGLLAFAYPRARSAWAVHDLAAKAADYGLCMAGPTGPQLLRDDVQEFRRVVRRRLIAAAPEEAPFAACAKLAVALSGAPEAEKKHLTKAGRYAEYGVPDGPAPELSLASLHVSLDRLADETRAAWPFVRGGYAKLVRASLGAREAVHPIAPARPGVGRGLPSERALPERGWRANDGLWLTVGEGATRTAYVSQDDGVTFRRGHVESTDEAAGACGGRDRERGFSLSSREDGSLVVTSFGPNREPSQSVAVVGEHSLTALSCDDHALVLGARLEGNKIASLVLCAHERPCVPLKPPERAPFAPLTAEQFDVARVAGATVLAVESSGVVRVVSSRDDGKTWTPPAVAFDAGDGEQPRTQVATPSRLVAIGSRLFLYGAAARVSHSYPLLVSDDQGASFRPLEPSETPAARPARVARGER